MMVLGGVGVEATKDWIKMSLGYIFQKYWLNVTSTSLYITVTQTEATLPADGIPYEREDYRQWP